jgi:deoxyribonuclease-4
MRLGIHMTQKGGFARNVRRAAEIGCETLQVFIGSPTSWRAPQLDASEVEKRRHVLLECGIEPLIVHTAYLINLASKKEEFLIKSGQLLQQTMSNAHLLGSLYVILHVGSHGGRGYQEGLDLFISTMKREMQNWPFGVELLLENTAGAGTSLGGSFTTIGKILHSLGEEAPVGVCLDTAHAWAAGYDLSTPGGLAETMDELSEHIGMDRVKVIHFNDSVSPRGSYRDRHAHLGEGTIGEEGLQAFLSYPWPEDMPVILETPDRGTDKDALNLARLRSYVSKCPQGWGKHKE